MTMHVIALKRRGKVDTRPSSKPQSNCLRSNAPLQKSLHHLSPLVLLVSPDTGNESLSVVDFRD